MGQGRFGHDRILSGVIVCHVVGNNGVFPERGSRGPCVGFWVPGSIWQRMWYFCAKFLWIKGVFYHGLCVIIYAGRIVPCLHWYLIRVIGPMTSLEWFSIWETSNNIINFNDVRKRLWKLVSMRVGGLGNKGSSCPGRILSLSAFVTVCDSSEAEWRHYE